MTTINDKQKYLFIHIPKNAGTAMYRVLGKASKEWDWHAPAKVIQDQLPDWDKYYKFAFVRNPWSRMVSLYARFTKTDPRWKGLDPNSAADFSKWLLTWDDSINRAAYEKAITRPAEIVKDTDLPVPTLERKWFGQTAHWDEPISSTKMSQLYYLTDGQGKILVDEIGRYETIDRDFKAICLHLGLGNVELPRAPHGPYSRPWQEYYVHNATEDHIWKYFANDIKTFDYKFE